MNVYSEMKMPIGIFSWKYESFSTLALHEKKKKKGNESLLKCFRM